MVYIKCEHETSDLNHKLTEFIFLFKKIIIYNTNKNIKKHI
jgi:hypothetical protein